jgi:hypothetical protein
MTTTFKKIKKKEKLGLQNKYPRYFIYGDVVRGYFFVKILEPGGFIMSSTNNHTDWIKSFVYSESSILDHQKNNGCREISLAEVALLKLQ